MCYYVIKSNGKVESHTSVQRVTNLELQTNEVKKWCQEFNKALDERFNDEQFVIFDGAKTQPTDWQTVDLEANNNYNDEFHNVVSDP